MAHALQPRHRILTNPSHTGLETLDLSTLARVQGGKLGSELHALGALFKDFRKITHDYGLAGSAASVKVVADGLRGKRL